jgi:hypothetical protein
MMELTLKSSEELVPAAIDHLLFDEFRRVDGEFKRHGKRYLYSAYRVGEMVRIDIHEVKP